MNHHTGGAARRAAVLVALIMHANPEAIEPSIQSSRQPPVQLYRSGVDMVALAVTVEQADGSFVPDLYREDFRVFDGGVQQDVSVFRGGEVPIDLVLLLDTSASMTARLKTATHAAINFVRRLRPADRAAIMEFGRTVGVRQGFTADVAALEAAIRATRPSGATALYDALYVSLNEFDQPRGGGAEIRRRAIVVLTDGDDTVSLITFDAVLDLARRTGIAIYPIAFRDRSDVLLPADRLRRARYELRTLARETGARVFFPSQLWKLDNIYALITEELAHQYALGYVPRDSLSGPRFRHVQVIVNHPGATARTRRGYLSER
jgi:Ca-activated chloride channel family protein